MTSPSTKRLILMILVVVLGVVWWRSLRVVSRAAVPAVPSATTPSVAPITHKPSVHVTYAPPRINPFVAGNPQTSHIHNTASVAVPVTPSVPDVQLIGCLPGRLPHAIVRLHNGDDVILARGDTISGWTLRTISDAFIVLARGKRNDTLRIGHGF